MEIEKQMRLTVYPIVFELAKRLLGVVMIIGYFLMFLIENFFFFTIDVLHKRKKRHNHFTDLIKVPHLFFVSVSELIRTLLKNKVFISY
jgi:hypothetical protein